MLTVFEFEQNTIRFVGTPDDPWWVAADVCVVLEIAKPENVYARLDEDEKDTRIVGTLGGEQKMICINQSGLYSLVLTSRKPQAKRFKKWVTSEVLPSIQKTGSYVLTQVDTQPQQSLALLSEQRAKYVYDFTDEVLSRVSKISPEYRAIYAARAMEAHIPESASIAKVIVGAVQETVATSDRHLTPSELGEIHQKRHSLPKPIRASDINIALLDAGLQSKEVVVKIDKQTGKEKKINRWHLTESGKEWGVVVQDKARGHEKTVEHVRWLPTVLEAIRLGGES